ncbi:hypothetical protein CYMTET_17380 [Cymbomonas tetramitiformis]|uniref:Uncharacterized protein n=1 Tax=Cymbomonas tetramitiformis TaxID=36881 RepID=A0AAE0GA77_9CHLO|nr:hypothetical protein CYMTET_17380 [Cymbomonas tetramitiformis]
MIGIAKAVSLSIVLYTMGAHAALPPGYEDELLCQRPSCLRRKEVMPGMVGGKRLYWECFDESASLTSTPEVWGFRLAPDKKDKLMSDGFASEVYCNEADAPKKTTEPKIMMKPVIGKSGKMPLG